MMVSPTQLGATIRVVEGRVLKGRVVEGTVVEAGVVEDGLGDGFNDVSSDHASRATGRALALSPVR